MCVCMYMRACVLCMCARVCVYVCICQSGRFLASPPILALFVSLNGIEHQTVIMFKILKVFIYILYNTVRFLTVIYSTS